jgi:hypothetical protein
MLLALVSVASAQRRSAVRYNLRLPVIFHWNDGTEHTEGGFTSDIALDGALILSSRCPPVGSKIRIEVLLPSPYESGGEVWIECAGIVSRVADDRGRSSFGVQGYFNDDQLMLSVLM